MQPTASGVDIILCSAGHPLPLVRRTAGAVVPVGVPGTLLGVTDEVSLSDTVVHLDPGESLVCYTDGLTDRRNGRRVFGEEGVVKALYQGKGLEADELARLIEGEALGLRRRRAGRRHGRAHAAHVAPLTTTGADGVDERNRGPAVAVRPDVAP